jgi:hypothetical protein
MSDRRKSPNERGYGRGHRALRRRLAPQVEAGQAVCARCHAPILPGEKWDLDHTDDRTGYLGPSHARCNRGATPRRPTFNSDTHPAPWRSPSGTPTSRQWGDDYVTAAEWRKLPADERQRRREL